MKKALIICIIIFVVAAIAFGISVAATGVKENKGFGISVSGTPFLVSSFGFTTKAGDVKEYTFNDSVRDIEIVTSVAETNVTVADVDKISVKYETETGGYNFNAKVDGDTLVVKEEGGFLFSFFSFDEKKSKLEIILPEKEYADVEIVTASGNTVIDNLVCKELESVITSGNSKYNIFASEISVTTTSGCVEVKNCTDRKANKISLDSVSGSHTISGFKCNEFKFNSVSGCIKAEGISGRGNADVVSGEMIIEYAEWDNNLKLNAVSGEFDITLPEDSGVEIDLDALSGEVDVILSKEEEGGIGYVQTSLSGESNSGELGGDNVHEVKVDLVSGDVSIHN